MAGGHSRPRAERSSAPARTRLSQARGGISLLVHRSSIAPLVRRSTTATLVLNVNCPTYRAVVAHPRLPQLVFQGYPPVFARRVRALTDLFPSSCARNSSPSYWPPSGDIVEMGCPRSSQAVGADLSQVRTREHRCGFPGDPEHEGAGFVDNDELIAVRP
ncbi:hypothetical protein BD311DRAFT_762028 [Dichomitus squalens]|uniref:Uncharacterized protein n=1 Tax=Dichomitus squalens TaxID=114155 RepID=A0A4Q9MGX2_9APHY|nr:hypothetical protein BD311DRAFT_762028 [Dichomitus squalens]